jgi:hypothetical protein
MHDHTTTILHVPTGITVVGMDKDVSAIGMVRPTKENTSLIYDMGGVYSRGLMEQSMMECLMTTRNTEGYVPAPSFSWFQEKRRSWTAL